MEVRAGGRQPDDDPGTVLPLLGLRARPLHAVPRQPAEELPPVLAGVPSERNLSRHHPAVRIDLDIHGAIDAWHRRQPPSRRHDWLSSENTARIGPRLTATVTARRAANAHPDVCDNTTSPPGRQDQQGAY